MHGKKTHLETEQVKILASLFLLSHGIRAESFKSLVVLSIPSSESGRHYWLLAWQLSCGPMGKVERTVKI